jgi:glycine reductase
VVLLGTPTPESSELYAVTMTEGDPSWAGALAGVSLNLPVYHITEDEIKAQSDPDLYEDEVGISEMVLDLEPIKMSVKSVRERTTGAG